MAVNFQPDNLACASVSGHDTLCAWKRSAMLPTNRTVGRTGERAIHEIELNPSNWIGTYGGSPVVCSTQTCRKMHLARDQSVSLISLEVPAS
jgi:hypothetical protein